MKAVILVSAEYLANDAFYLPYGDGLANATLFQSHKAGNRSNHQVEMLNQSGKAPCMVWML